MSGDADLIARVRRGDVRALSRVCRKLEEGVLDESALDDLIDSSRLGWTLGVTGSPGAGKSTLTNQLIKGSRQRGWRVAVVAVDPTSPFSGGAVLGDRIRMQEHFGDEEVFIRSLATRGALGGLAHASFDIVRAMQLWGADVVMVETVGVGQAELDVMDVCDTTLIVVAPGMGDSVQAAKAGILEIADVLVVNKADHPDAQRTLSDLQGMLALGNARALERPFAAHGASGVASSSAAELGDGAWQVPLMATTATSGQGVDEVLQALHRHRAWLETEVGSRRQARNLARRARRRLEHALSSWIEQHHGAAVDALALEVAAGRRRFSDARRRLLEQLQSSE